MYQIHATYRNLSIDMRINLKGNIVAKGSTFGTMPANWAFMNTMLLRNSLSTAYRVSQYMGGVFYNGYPVSSLINYKTN